MKNIFINIFIKITCALKHHPIPDIVDDPEGEHTLFLTCSCVKYIARVRRGKVMKKERVWRI